MRSNHKATALGFTAVILWGTLALFTAMTGAQLPPFQLMALTFAIAFVLMMCKWRYEGHWGQAAFRQPAGAWLLGVSGYFGYHFCYFLAMSKAPAVEVSLIAYLWPLFIVLLSGLLPGQRLSAFHLLGAGLALLGCWALLSADASGFDPQYMPGYLIALLCAFIWSGFSVASRLYARVPTDAAGWFCGVTAVLAFVAHLWLEESVWPETPTVWLGVLGLGLGPVGLAFFTWDYGVKHGDIRLLGVLSYAAPVFSVLWLVLFGFGQASGALGFACAAIVLGSLLAAWSSHRISLVGQEPQG